MAIMVGIQKPWPREAQGDTHKDSAHPPERMEERVTVRFLKLCQVSSVTLESMLHSSVSISRVSPLVIFMPGEFEGCVRTSNRHLG